MNMGIHKGSGNVQLYKLGRVAGNARISVGSSATMKAIRAELLASPWFVDAMVAPGTKKTPGNERGHVDIIFQPDGTMLLPALSVDSAEHEEMRSVLKKVHVKMGESGKKVMKGYMKECGITD